MHISIVDSFNPLVGLGVVSDRRSRESKEPPGRVLRHYNEYGAQVVSFLPRGLGRSATTTLSPVELAELDADLGITPEVLQAALPTFAAF